VVAADSSTMRHGRSADTIAGRRRSRYRLRRSTQHRHCPRAPEPVAESMDRSAMMAAPFRGIG
jgi:hypothetical protein